jgi:hypothetical protein
MNMFSFVFLREIGSKGFVFAVLMNALLHSRREENKRRKKGEKRLAMMI